MSAAAGDKDAVTGMIDLSPRDLRRQLQEMNHLFAELGWSRVSKRRLRRLVGRAKGERRGQ